MPAATPGMHSLPNQAASNQSHPVRGHWLLSNAVGINRYPVIHTWPYKLAEAIPAHARGRPIELWWQDEARIGQQGTLTRVWAERGSRPRAPRDQRYDWAYLFGAVCPARDAGVALVLPVANSEMMNLHLAEISRNVTPGNHAVVLLDGAGWHQTGDKLNVPDNISLLKLPAYSPELNPVENIWQYLRQNRLSNRVFESYDAIVDACCDAWNELTAEPGRIQSIATRPWASVIV